MLMHLRVLLVESDPEDLLFLEEVLLEIEEKRLWNPHWHQWVHVETLAASTWMEAAAMIPREPVDVILLNPNLGDSLGAATFRRLQALAPHIPVILLTEAEDRDLAAHLVREGAQDFLNKKQIDCAPWPTLFKTPSSASAACWRRAPRPCPIRSLVCSTGRPS